MRKKEKMIHCLEVMDAMFKDYPLTELEYRTPLQLLIAVMLSAQTTDKQVNKVTASFFSSLHTPKDIIAMGEDGVRPYIKTVGLHRSKTVNVVKTGHILQQKTVEKQQQGWVWGGSYPKESIRDIQYQYSDAQELFEQRGYYIPDTLDEMIELAGVGIKTAKVVLYVLYGQRRVAVDTHVHRVMNRLGLVKTSTPEKTSTLLEKLIPDEYKDVAHRVVIYFGRYHCMARKPQCASCPLQSLCAYYKTLSKNTKK